MKPHVVVLGAGFAGDTAALHLSRLVAGEADILKRIGCVDHYDAGRTRFRALSPGISLEIASQTRLAHDSGIGERRWYDFGDNSGRFKPGGSW